MAIQGLLRRGAIEHATFANLAKTFRKLEEVAIDEPSIPDPGVLRRWMYGNIKTLLQASSMGQTIPR